jgi:hypothetical protein
MEDCLCKGHSIYGAQSNQKDNDLNAARRSIRTNHQDWWQGHRSLFGEHGFLSQPFDPDCEAGRWRIRRNLVDEGSTVTFICLRPKSRRVKLSPLGTP